MIYFLTRVKRAILVRLKIACNAMKYCFFCFLPHKKEQKIWVICERGLDARDNGYAFYRYMIEKHPEIMIYYLIDITSADYYKVEKHAIPYGSWKNYWVVAKAERVISTHCYTALPGISEKVWKKMGLEKKFYFLQHGITTGYLPYLFGDRSGMKLFCCAAVPEYEYVKENFRHPNGVVQCTGFARYDQLMTFSCKEQILIMPTWRRYINSEKDFLESEYFKRWNEVLADQKLLKYLSDTNMKLIFYPHYELQPYLQHFQSANNNVILADFENYDVQKLLKESKLLITDYSSVFFDFAYMNKPSLYYQFDEERYYQGHYQKGYFNFEQNGFGEVIKNHDFLIDRILDIAKNDYVMDEIYQNRTKEFYKYRDQKNCERIFRAITHL